MQKEETSLKFQISKKSRLRLYINKSIDRKMSQKSAKSAVVKKHVLVAWQDSDVADQIKDRAFAGRLANKENQENAANDANEAGKLLKKRRVSKRPSIVSQTVANELNLDSMSISTDAASKPAANQQSAGSKASSHFVFGNQAADGISKTSNNKLDQSHRISYHEMCEVLKTYRNAKTDEAIEQMNKFYEAQYFPEWFKLMKYEVYFFYGKIQIKSL